MSGIESIMSAARIENSQACLSLMLCGNVNEVVKTYKMAPGLRPFFNEEQVLSQPRER